MTTQNCQTSCFDRFTHLQLVSIIFGSRERVKDEAKTGADKPESRATGISFLHISRVSAKLVYLGGDIQVDMQA